MNHCTDVVSQLSHIMRLRSPAGGLLPTIMFKRFLRATTVFSSVLLVILHARLVCGQSGATSTGSSVQVTIPTSVTQNGFTGSVPDSKLSAEPLPITFLDAIDRGLRHNLGLLLSSDETIAARGEKWKQLSNLLPNVDAKAQESVEKVAAAQIGLRFPGIPRVIGPFNYMDVRAFLNQSVFNWNFIQKERAAAESLRASRYPYK